MNISSESTQRQPKFIILGAGINGLSCAYRLRQHFPAADIEIISDKFSPNTTSDVAAGLWEPFLLGDTPTELVIKWSRETYEYFHELWRTGNADGCGISLIPYLALTSKVDGLEEPIWKSFALGYQELSAQRLAQLGREHGTSYVSGNEFITFTCEPSRLMHFYTEALKATGASFRQQKITCWQELMACTTKNSTPRTPIVINCLGLGWGNVQRDDALVPTRGQIKRIHAPWVYHVLINDEGYVIPNTGSVTMGGTKQKGDHELAARSEDALGIEQGCCKLVRALERAPVAGDFVGLRPTRSAVRLEVQWINEDPFSRIPIVHNYGHGGGGITLAWGCASEVLNLVQQLLISGDTSSRLPKVPASKL